MTTPTRSAIHRVFDCGALLRLVVGFLRAQDICCAQSTSRALFDACGSAKHIGEHRWLRISDGIAPFARKCAVEQRWRQFVSTGCDFKSMGASATTRLRLRGMTNKTVRSILGVTHNSTHIAVVFQATTMSSKSDVVGYKEQHKQENKQEDTSSSTTASDAERKAPLFVNVNDDDEGGDGAREREHVAVWRVPDLSLVGVWDIGDNDQSTFWFGCHSSHIQLSFPFGHDELSDLLHQLFCV